MAIKPGSHQREPAPPDTPVSLRFPSDPHPDPLLHRSDPVSGISHQFPQKLLHIYLFSVCFFLIVLVHWATLLNTAPGVLWWWCYCLCQVSGGRAELCALHVMNADRRQKAEIIFSPLFTAYSTKSDAWRRTDTKAVSEGGVNTWLGVWSLTHSSSHSSAQPNRTFSLTRS